MIRNSVLCLLLSLTISGWSVCSLDRHETGLDEFALSPDGARIAALAEDGTLFLWDVATGKQTQLSSCFTASGFHNAMTFSPDSLSLAVAGSSFVNIFDVTSGQLVHNLSGSMQNIRRLNFSGDGLRLAVVHEKGASVWAVKEHEEILSISEWTEPLALALNHNGNLLALESGRGIALWDVESALLLRTIELPELHWAKALVFANQDKWLVSEVAWKRDPQPPHAIFIELDRQMVIWDATTGAKLRILDGDPGEPVLPLTTAGSDSLFLGAYPSYGSLSEWVETLTEWDLSSGKVAAVWKTPVGAMSGEVKLLLREVGPPGRLDLWRIGDAQDSVQTYEYRSPTCVFRDVTDSGEPAVKFESHPNLMFDGVTNDRSRWSGAAYVATDCSPVTTRHTYFPSAERAHAELNAGIAKATVLWALGPRAGHWFEDLLEQRAVLAFHDPWSHADYFEIDWTHGSDYFTIGSWSLAAALELENQWKRK